MRRSLSPLISLFLLLTLTACQVVVTGSNQQNSQPSDGSSHQHPTAPDQNAAQLRLGDRFFVASVFRNIFGNHAELMPAIELSLKVQSPDFAPSCDKFGPAHEDCSVPAPGFLGQDYVLYHNSRLPSVSSVTSSREGTRLQACSKAVHLSQALVTAIGQVRAPALVTVQNLNNISMPSEEDIKKAYNLFFPARDASSDVIQTLEELATAAASSAAGDQSGIPRFPSVEAWKFVLFALCSSPAWQTR